jgi:hypothetical protein
MEYHSNLSKRYSKATTLVFSKDNFKFVDSETPIVSEFSSKLDNYDMGEKINLEKCLER